MSCGAAGGRAEASLTARGQRARGRRGGGGCGGLGGVSPLHERAHDALADVVVARADEDETERERGEAGHLERRVRVRDDGQQQLEHLRAVSRARAERARSRGSTGARSAGGPESGRSRSGHGRCALRCPVRALRVSITPDVLSVQVRYQLSVWCSPRHSTRTAPHRPRQPLPAQPCSRSSRSRVRGTHHPRSRAPHLLLLRADVGHAKAEER